MGSPAVVILLLFFILLVFNCPIAMALTMCSIIFLWMNPSIPVSLVTGAFFHSVDSFTLLAVPFFILAGELMIAGGISKRLIKACTVLFRKATGSLGAITVVACMIFAAISGSGPATVASMGGIMIPAMIKAGYDRGYACSLAAAGGSIGPVIPPSLCFIMYGIIAQVSITDLFMGGVIPGILMGVCLLVYNYIVSKKNGYGAAVLEREINPKTGKPESDAHILLDAIWALLVPVIILGGIYGGIFTPTEAAVIACDYALVVGVLVYRELKVKDLLRVLARTTLTCGTTMLLVCAATAFGRLLTMQKVPAAITALITGISTNKYVVLLMINILLFFVGMLMETLSGIIIFTPLLLPLVTSLGVNPLHFGVIITVNMVIGQLTPPVGVNSIIGAQIGGIKMDDMFKRIVVAVAVLLVALILVTNIPALSTWLPSVLN